MGSLLELRWHVDSEGYVLEEEGVPMPTGSVLAVLSRAYLGDRSRRALVVPRGGESKLYRRKADKLDILRAFLNMPSTPDGVLGFVNRWGLLSDPARELDDPAREDARRVDWFIDIRDLFRGVLRGEGLPHSAGELELASLKLVRGSTGQLSLHADTLGDFLWAQVFQLSDKAVFRCSICNKFGLAKETRREGKGVMITGRSRDYCSDACKMKAYRQRLRSQQR